MQVLLALSGLVDKIHLDLDEIWKWLLHQLGFDAAAAPPL